MTSLASHCADGDGDDGDRQYWQQNLFWLLLIGNCALKMVIDGGDDGDSDGFLFIGVGPSYI